MVGRCFVGPKKKTSGGLLVFNPFCRYWRKIELELRQSHERNRCTHLKWSVTVFSMSFNSLVYLTGPRVCQRSHIWQIPLQSDRHGKLCQGSQSTPCCVSAFHQTSLLPEQYIDLRLQRIWLFFRKWRTHTLWWVQNWNLRHIFWFLSLFCCLPS